MSSSIVFGGNLSICECLPVISAKQNQKKNVKQFKLSQIKKAIISTVLLVQLVA